MLLSRLSNILNPLPFPRIKWLKCCGPNIHLFHAEGPAHSKRKQEFLGSTDKQQVRSADDVGLKQKVSSTIPFREKTQILFQNTFGLNFPTSSGILNKSNKERRKAHCPAKHVTTSEFILQQKLRQKRHLICTVFVTIRLAASEAVSTIPLL